MELTGTVLNVVDFGCFVDIGMHESGLVHVSRLADKFVRDPHDVVAVGDIVRVWVLAIDKQRRRVSLTMVASRQRAAAIRRGAASARKRPKGSAQGRSGRTGSRDEGARPPRPPRPARPAGESRPPQSRPAGHGRPQCPQEQRPPYRQQQHAAPRPKPRPMIPITDAMKVGKEPMRTFGDLLQFYQQKPGVDGQPLPAGLRPRPPRRPRPLPKSPRWRP